jgi:hypothetical protein
MEVRSPTVSNEDLALCDVPSISPTVVETPIDYWSTRRSSMDLRFKEILSLAQQSNPEGGTLLSVGSIAFAPCPQSPSKYSIDSISLTYTSGEDTVISQEIDSPNEEEPRRSDLQLNPPKPEGEMRRTSLLLRRVSSAGPAPPSLSPPPIKVRFPNRRGTAPPKRLPSTTSPRRRSHRPSKRSHMLQDSAQNVSEPRSPAPLTPEEGSVQFQIRVQQAENNGVYIRSVNHVRGLSSRPLPTPPLPTVRPIRPLPPLPVSPPLGAFPDKLDGVDIRS